MTEPSASLAF
ncbi:hypothetical protein VCHC28A1_2293, partial [Vibrio cholerae HC-28A1]